MNKPLKVAFALLLVLQMMFPYGSQLKKAEASTVQLKDLDQGAVINFANYDWIVLEPSTGYLLMKDILPERAFDPDNTKYFDPSDSNNIGYYLNTEWLGTLSEKDKKAIQEKKHGI